jgi:hypothetical protein
VGTVGATLGGHMSFHQATGADHADRMAVAADQRPHTWLASRVPIAIVSAVRGTASGK